MTRQKWTIEEESYLKANYLLITVTEIANHLSKTEKSVMNKASRMKLKKHKDWSLEEDRFLIDNYSDLGIHGCSVALDRSVLSIRNRTNRLNLSSNARINQNADNHKIWLESIPEFRQLGSYCGTKKKTLFKHIECGYEWYTTPATLKGSLSKGTAGCPYCSARRKYSKVAIQWLDSLSNSNILHAENVGEQVVSGYKVDGYDPTTNTVYEFHGDAYHGNLDVYDPNTRCHPYDKTITAEELWDKTFLKMKALSEVANVIYIWENDFRNKKPYSNF